MGLVGMTIQTEFPGILPADAAAIAKNVQFFEDGYDLVVNRIGCADRPVIGPRIYRR